MSTSRTPLPRRNLPLMLLQVRELVLANFRPMLKDAGVTEQQWRVLRALFGEGSLEPKQIVRVCCLSSASLVGILVRMEDLGLITRKPVAGDQRRVLISPSAKGRRLALQLAPQIDLIYSEIEAELGTKLVGELFSVLDRVQEQFKGGTPSAP